MVGDHAARLDISGTDNRIYPLVQLSKLKLVRQYPDRPNTVLVVDESDRVDFDEALLPEDIWDAELEDNEYEVEMILDKRMGRKARYGRIKCEYLVQWKGYSDSSWVDEVDLNCGGLLEDYERRQVTRNCFEVMQSHEE
ncbi:unnamed protein product [Peronospora effusa]|nr:unnamed protein product [Peronospora effusa]